MSNHLNDQQLIGYIHQTLTDAEREEIDRHLAECGQCRALLGDYEALQRRIHYGLAIDRRKVTPSARKTFAAVAPRLKGGRRLAAVRLTAERFSVVAVLATVFVFVYSLLGNSLYTEQPLGEMPDPVGGMFRGGPQRTGAYDSKKVPGRGEAVWTLHIGHTFLSRLE